MARLSMLEKRIFEDLFGMSGGYVLDFSNATFAQFFREVTSVNIYSPKYADMGDSKGKRLRTFWEKEPDPVVGKVLSSLLDVYHYSKKPEDIDQQRVKKAQEVVQRLTGKSPSAASTESDFLRREFAGFSLEKLQIESSLLPIMKNRLGEVEHCINHAPLSAIILCGSILEGILLGIALQRPKDFNLADGAPKDKEGKVKQFHEWSLAQFIDVAYGLGVLGLDIKKFSHSLRDFRNYIHPYEQAASGFNPDVHTAKICFQVLRAAIASLSGDRK